MQDHVSRIDENGLAALRGLIGVSPYELYFPALDADLTGQVFTCPVLSMSLPENGFIVVTNEWLESREEDLDYWKLSVKHSDLPQNVRYDQEKNEFAYPVSTLSFTPAKAIVRVEIYDAEETEDRDRVIYDETIVLQRNGSRPISFSSRPDISDRIDIRFGGNVLRYIGNRRPRTTLS